MNVTMTQLTQQLALKNELLSVIEKNSSLEHSFREFSTGTIRKAVFRFQPDFTETFHIIMPFSYQSTSNITPRIPPNP